MSSSENMGALSDHMFLPIQQSNESLVHSIKTKMESISMSRCIFRVQDTNDTTFEPKLISIGPYHHAKESLKVMEDHKWKYSFALLTRKPNLQARLEKCLNGLRELEHRGNICYAGKLSSTSEEFLEIMLIDGCFIIELLIRYNMKNMRPRGDPFFGHPGKISTLRLDMGTLGNQIPFFVLQMLFSLVPIPEQCPSLNELSFRFFKHIIPGDNSSFRDKFSQPGYHFLDMIRNHLLPVSQKLSPKVTTGSSTKMINCATILKLSGLVLKENTEHPSALLDIIFTKSNNVLAIPLLKIQQNTEALLRNLIEFEKCCSQVGDYTLYITSYALLMHNLICSEKDVELLEKKGIVKSYLPDRNAVVEMFKRICSGIELKQNLYGELCEQVNGCRKKKWFQLGSIFKNKPSG